MGIATDATKEMFNNMGLQLASYALIIAAAYAISYLLLGVFKVPASLKKFISSLVTLGVIYFAFNQIFLKV